VAQRKAEADKTIAEEELARAQNQCEWTEKLSAKGYVTGTELIADRLAVTKGRLQLDQADRALEVLKKYTAKKDLKKYELDLQLAKAALDRATLKANAEEVKAKADVTAKKSSFVHYRKRLQKLQDQLEKTRITAPQDGMVVYATTEAWRRERMIEKGAQVHENQLILSLPDVTSMAVDVEVHESWVDQVREGLPALISTDALPNLSLKGKVTKVGILPDSVNRVLNPDLKVYLTEITLDDAPEIKLIRPGMSAKVQVIINVVKEVLFVPVQSVTTVDRQQVCYLLQGEEFVPKPVRGGQYNESYIEIVSGLKDGDIVKLNAPAPQGGKQVKEEKEALELAKSIKSRLQDPPPRPTEAAESHDRKPKKKWSPKREKKESDDVPRPAGDTVDPSSLNRPPADTGTTSDKTKTTRKITDEDEGAVAYPRARGRLRDDREAGEE
jgi:HlyD family secretion protein